MGPVHNQYNDASASHTATSHTNASTASISNHTHILVPYVRTPTVTKLTHDLLLPTTNTRLPYPCARDSHIQEHACSSSADQRQLASQTVGVRGGSKRKSAAGSSGGEEWYAYGAQEREEGSAVARAWTKT